MKPRTLPNTIRVQRYPSPCGDLLLGSFEGRLCLCDWGRADRVYLRLQRVLGAHYEMAPSDVATEAARQLDDYFARRRREFDVPLLFAGTPFQEAVWNELLNIPYGATPSYAALSARLKMPGAVRAVAGAVGANPISIFAPCHRVIGSDGSLTGYGGGLGAKKMLLELETDYRLDL